ncbi:MAG: hypothetical protein IJZ36_01215 [Bacilli bacterium]|nr:hypothetical protein [Bacilli bacterium]
MNYEDIFKKFNKNDFILNIQVNDLNEYKTYIYIYNVDDYSIIIDKENYTIDANKMDMLKKLVNEKMNELIACSLVEDNNFIKYHGYEGGLYTNILVKYGSLIIKINASVDDKMISEFGNNFINDIVDIIKK